MNSLAYWLTRSMPALSPRALFRPRGKLAEGSLAPIEWDGPFDEPPVKNMEAAITERGLTFSFAAPKKGGVIELFIDTRPHAENYALSRHAHHFFITEEGIEEKTAHPLTEKREMAHPSHTTFTDKGDKWKVFLSARALYGFEGVRAIGFALKVGEESFPMGKELPFARLSFLWALLEVER